MSVTLGTMEHARQRVGTMVKDKWRVEALLGAGGTACVYSAVHRNGRRVAIKVLHPELSAVPNLVTRFLREGYLANRVGHPNAVVVLDDDRTEDGAVFLVMELLEGHSLERHAKAGGQPLPRSTVLRLIDETLDVLGAAHAKGIVHRDIKPANLFVTTEGHIKVLDFGIAGIAEPLGDGSLTQTGLAIGTPSFMPPEQARGRWELVDARTDLWAVGATLYALLTGDRPRRGETSQEELLLAMTQPLTPIATVLPDLSPEVAAVVDRAVAYDRDARWPSAAAMRQALAGLIGNAVMSDTRAGLLTPEAALGGGARTDLPTLALPDGALTTGRPFSSPALRSVPPFARGGRNVRALVIGLAALGLLMVATVITFVVSRRVQQTAAASPALATEMWTATATATTNPVRVVPSSPPPDTAAASVPPPPSPLTEPPSSRPAASAAPMSSVRPKLTPAGPRGPAPNPFDQRF